MSDAKKCDVCGAYGDEIPYLNFDRTHIMDLCHKCRTILGADGVTNGEDLIVVVFRELIELLAAKARPG